MSARPPRRGFSSRPADPDAWVRAPERSVERGAGAEFTARLTIDVTPALRGQIKVAAFRPGLTVADMLRELLAGAFPDDGAAR